MKKKEVAMTVGVFDCLHEGHINLLREMRERADKVVVLLHDDHSTFANKGRYTVQLYSHRKRNLLMCGLVDEVQPVKDMDPSARIENEVEKVEERKELVYMRGDDWAEFPGKETVRELGVAIEMVPYTEGVSTSQIREDLK